MTPVIGDNLKPFRLGPVSAEAMKYWAQFLRDPNPIHLDPQAVKARGLGNRVINQGPANLAYLINMLLAAWPGARMEALNVRYVDNVYSDDVVEAGGKVTDVAQSESLRVTCEIWLRATARAEVITGTAIVTLPSS